MTTRAVVILAIVATALGALVLIDARVRPGGTDERAAARARVLPPFDRKSVRQISIQRQRGEAFALVHAPSPAAPAPAPAWRIETVNAPAADDAAIDDLLAALDLAESERIAEISPEAAGLQPPVAEVALQTAAAVREATDVITLQLGRPDAAGRGVYARAGTTGPIRVVGRRVLELADRDASAFRDRRLFPVDPAAVTSIAWRDQSGAGELRAADGRWQNGHQEWVDEGRVFEALRRLFALRIEAFEGGARGKPESGHALVLTAGPAEVIVDGGKDGVLVRGADRVRVPADALESAWRALAGAAARDNRLIAMAPETVTRIDLFDDHGRVTLRRAGGAWAFSTPRVDYAADTPAVDEWLARLGTITVATRATGPNMRHLILDGRFRQKLEVSSPPDVHALLAPDPLRFRERVVLSFAHFDVRRLRRFTGKTDEDLITDDGARWRSRSGAQVDTASVARVVGALSDLRAEEFLAVPPTGAAPQMQIDVQPPGDAHPMAHVLQLWPQKDGGCVARLDADATFKPERSTCDALRLPLLTKTE